VKYFSKKAIAGSDQETEVKFETVHLSDFICVHI
jgi:hypothetical protein